MALNFDIFGIVIVSLVGFCKLICEQKHLPPIFNAIGVLYGQFIACVVFCLLSALNRSEKYGVF